MIKILVVDDHPAVREGTRSILETTEGISVETFSPPYTMEAVSAINFAGFDVILMDLNLGEDINGLELSKVILNITDQCKIILFTGYDIEDYMIESFRIGLHGALNKNASKEKTINYIKSVLNDEVILPLDFVNKLIASSPSPETTEQLEQLTDREKAILIALDQGLTNQEISDQLNFSKRTIEYNLTSIYNKLGVSTRVEAVLTARASGALN